MDGNREIEKSLVSMYQFVCTLQAFVFTVLIIDFGCYCCCGKNVVRVFLEATNPGMQSVQLKMDKTKTHVSPVLNRPVLSMKKSILYVLGSNYCIV